MDEAPTLDPGQQPKVAGNELTHSLVDIGRDGCQHVEGNPLDEATFEWIDPDASDDDLDVPNRCGKPASYLSSSVFGGLFRVCFEHAAHIFTCRECAPCFGSMRRAD